MRLLGLLCFRNEMRWLPGYLEALAPIVDGIVALDDGSTDGSTDLVSSHPAVLTTVRRRVRDPHEWNDARNHRMVVEASWAFAPDWLIAVDADERLEVGFRARAEDEIARAVREGIDAYTVAVPELWGGDDTYRVDGIWGTKRGARLFRARRDHQFHKKRFHNHWAPMNSRLPDGTFPPADLILYHLRMREPADRAARRDRYTALDPDRRFQPIGYDYLTDETGLELARVEEGRGYRA